MMPQRPPSLRRPGRLRARRPGDRPAADRPADEIVKEIEAIKRPTTFAEFQEANSEEGRADRRAGQGPPRRRPARQAPARALDRPSPSRARWTRRGKEIDETLAKTKDEDAEEGGPLLQGPDAS